MRARALLGSLALLVVLVAGATPAAAQPPGLQLRLLEISPAAGPDQPLGVRVEVTNPGGPKLQNLRLQVLTGQPIGTRSELQQRLASPNPPDPGILVGTRAIPGVEVAKGQRAALPPIGFEMPGWLGANGSGAVAPVGVRVLADSPAGPVQRTLDTYAVYVNDQVANRLRLSLLVPIVEATHRTPDKVFVDDALARLFDPAGPFGGVAAELAKPSSPPVSLVLDSLVVEEATAMTVNGWPLRPRGTAEPVAVPGNDPRSLAAVAFLRNLRAAASRPGAAPLAAPYANADLVALVRNRLEADALAQIAKGRRDLEAALGTRPDDSVAWPYAGAVDAPTLKTLADANVRAVVVDQALLPSESTHTQSAPVSLGGGAGRPNRALVPDPGLSLAVADSSSEAQPAVVAQRILAETAIAWLERPGGINPVARGILIAPPQSWRPSPAYFGALVRGLGAAPWLRVLPVQDLPRAVPPGPDDKGRTLAPYSQKLIERELPGPYLANVDAAKSRLTSFRSTVGPGYAPLEEYTRDLYVAESAAYRRSTPRFRGILHIRAVNQAIADLYRKVLVQETAVTLTARDGTIPVTMSNTSDQPLTVRLRLRSSKVDIPEPVSEPFVLAPHSGDTRPWRVRTRATGTFPITVEVLSGDGRARVTGADIVVRSTAINRVTLVLIGGASAFLILWWGRKRLRHGPRRAGQA